MFKLILGYYFDNYDEAPLLILDIFLIALIKID